MTPSVRRRRVGFCVELKVFDQNPTIHRCRILQTDGLEPIELPLDGRGWTCNERI